MTAPVIASASLISFGATMSIEQELAFALVAWWIFIILPALPYLNSVSSVTLCFNLQALEFLRSAPVCDYHGFFAMTYT